MNALAPVSFKKGWEHEPRLSKPYVPGKHHKRFWTEAECEIVRQYFPEGGASACLLHLPDHRTTTAVYALAHKLGVKKTGSKRGKKVVVPADFDDTLRAEWAQLNGKKKGEVAALADRFGVPRWWLSNRARKLGLTVAHKKEPNWTEAENALMKRAPLHDPDKAAEMFREHGFTRTPTAIVVRAKRLGLSRRATRETLSARAAARILGIDDKGITAACISGDLKAGRRGSKRLAQQGGDAWAITRADLRAYVLDNIECVDLRKVDKVEFVFLIATDWAAQEGDGGG